MKSQHSNYLQREWTYPIITLKVATGGIKLENGTLKDKIITLLKNEEGLTDREITNIILGVSEPQQAVNQACRSLETKQIIKRIRRDDGKFGNYLIPESLLAEPVPPKEDMHVNESLSVFAEDSIKKILEEFLHSNGWETQIAWGRTPGIDINAIRGNERWVIEVKGLGSSNPMNVNYFLGVLAETLQRMEDPNAKYSIALPDIKQFRNLWSRLPLLAKKRTGIIALFIDEQGTIDESE